ncbi:hypothetical protein D1872_303630 [compost metagenome]
MNVALKYAAMITNELLNIVFKQVPNGTDSLIQIPCKLRICDMELYVFNNYGVSCNQCFAG